MHKLQLCSFLNEIAGYSKFLPQRLKPKIYQAQPQA